MKMLLVTFMMMGFSLSAHAYGYGGGAVTCSATDNGWEEHWGGHGDCSSCLQKHGDCTETCSREENRCTAEGTVYDRFDSSRSHTETFRGRGSSRWDAESDAIRECRRYGASNCVSKNCDTETEIVSRRSCR